MSEVGKPKEISRRELFSRAAAYSTSGFIALQYPRALHAAEMSTDRLVLSLAEWNTVEAITGRIIPTDDEPGAIEAGCVNFIDKALANEDQALRPEYEVGTRGIDAVSRECCGKSFVELNDLEQDAVLIALESGSAAGWVEEIASEQFFATVRNHTVFGFLADPKYGGNRAYVGWRVMGYPGPRHRSGGYTTEQMRGEADIPTSWGSKLRR